MIIGTGDSLNNLKALASELKIDRYLWFTGFIPDDELVRYLSTADICVCPDPSSPLNNVSTWIKIMEYMTLGKPIVAFDLPEHRFTAQQAAVYVPPNDERAFARAIAELVDDPRRRVALGVFGRHRIKTQLAWEYSIPNLLGAYGLVLPLAAHSKRQLSHDAMIAIQPQTSSFAQTRNYKSGD